MIGLLSALLLLWLVLFMILHVKINLNPNEHLKSNEPSEKSLVIVICARNEELQIVKCLQSIARQRNLPMNTVVLVIDDHSEDATLEKVIAEKTKLGNIKIRVEKLTDGFGKKAALKSALKMVKADFIYFTDADCVLGSASISSMLACVETTQTKAAFGPILYNHSSFISNLLAAENLNTQCVTEAFFSAGKPILANAGNMMVSKEGLQKFAQSLNNQMVSGDDVFFVQQLQQGEFVGCFSHKAAVYTSAPKNGYEFWNQRLRWVSKASDYESALAKGFGAVMFIFSLFWLMSFVILLWYRMPFWALLLFLSKCVVEYCFHRFWFKKYDFEHSIWNAMVLSALYPFYVCIIATAALIGVGFDWKGRHHTR